LIADVAGGLISSSSSIEPMFDSSRYRYRVHVIDRVHETVVHDEDWKGDEAGARGSFDKIEHALDDLNVADFCREYGIKLGMGALTQVRSLHRWGVAAGCVDS